MWTWDDFNIKGIVKDLYLHYEQQNTIETLCYIIIALLVLIIILQIISLIQKHKIHAKSKSENEESTKEKIE